jgi:hypothetical protein
LTTVVTTVDALSLSIEAPVYPVASAVKTIVYAIAPAVKTIFHPVAPPVELGSPFFVAVFPCPVCPSVQAVVDAFALTVESPVYAIATTIQTSFDAIPPPVQPVFDPVACIRGQGLTGDDETQHHAKHNNLFHVDSPDRVKVRCSPSSLPFKTHQGEIG